MRPAPFREEDIPILTRLTSQFLSRHAPGRPVYRLAVSLAALAALSFALIGCGGGGGGSSVPPPTASTSVISGTVTDLNGNALVNANVTLNASGNPAVVSTQLGTYTIPNVTVPVGQTSRVLTIVGTATVGGRAWSGQNTVEVLADQVNTSNIHLVLSETGAQGSITGTVRDPNNQPIAGARVFVAPGPYTTTTTPPALFFSNLSSFVAFTDNSGNYAIPRLPPLATYTVAASRAGFLNQTVNNVVVVSGGATTSSFTLNPSSASASLPAVKGFSASCFTTPVSPTRAAGQPTDNGTAAIRDYILKLRGLNRHRQADPTRITRKASTRSAPNGYLIESDLFWDYESLAPDDLFGYSINRAAANSAAGNFFEIALLRDPLADRYSDLDAALTPEVTYYYSVARLDTIGFPANQNEGAPSDIVAVKPLGALALTGPAPGAVVAGSPTFAWTAVPRVALYKILLYDRFPNYHNDDPNAGGVTPFYSKEITGTQQIYDGATPLVSGQTYYWAVYGTDDVGSATTITAVQAFRIQ